MQTRRSGFTLVELIIVISALGILVTVGTIGWGTTVKWSQNKTRATELSQWKSTFELYKSRFATYPAPSNISTPYCLGNGFTSNRCGNTTSGSYAPSSDLHTQISRVSKLPENPHPLVNNTHVGPFVSYTATQAIITGVFAGGSSDCPPETTYDAARSPGNGVAYCNITLTR